MWPGHHRDKGDPEFARRQVQRGHPDAVWFMDGAKDSRSFEIGYDRPNVTLEGLFHLPDNHAERKLGWWTARLAILKPLFPTALIAHNPRTKSRKRSGTREEL